MNQALAIDPEKKTITLSTLILTQYQGMVVTDEIKEDTTRLLNEILESDEYNLVLINQNQFKEKFRSNLEQNVLSKLEKKGKVAWYEELTPKEREDYDKVVNEQRNYFPYDVNRSSKELFFKLVKKNMDSSHVPFDRNGEDVDLDPKLMDIIFSLGKITLESPFDPSKLKTTVNINNQPIDCTVNYKDKTLKREFDYCVKNLISTYYRKESDGSCNLMYADDHRVIKGVEPLLCENASVQKFEEVFKEAVLPRCLRASSCYENISGDEIVKLNDFFLKLTFSQRINSLREKVRSVPALDFHYELEKLSLDLDSFMSDCIEIEKPDLYLPELKGEDLSYYKERSNKIETHLKNKIGGLMAQEQRDRLLKISHIAFSNCVNEYAPLSKKERYLCDYELFFTAFERAVKTLALSAPEAYLEKKKSLIESTVGICPYREDFVSGENIPLSFDLNYDLNRCFDFLAAVNNKYDDISKLHSSDELQELTLSYDNFYTSAHILAFAKSTLEECHARDGAKDCLQESMRKTRAFSLAGSFPEGQLSRDPDTSSKILFLASGSSTLESCLSKVPSKEEIELCQKELLDEIKPGFFSLQRRYQSASDALLADLIPLKKELTREISIFHWGGGKKNDEEEKEGEEPIALTSLDNLKYTKAREFMFHAGPLINRFVGVEGAALAGRGLYAATDPNVTSHYGDTLYQIDIPRESEFLDLREVNSDGDIPLTKDTYEKMIKEGCPIDRLFVQNKEKAHKAKRFIPQTENTERADEGGDTPQRERRRGTLSEEEMIERYGAAYAAEGVSGYYAFVHKKVFEKHPQCHRIFKKTIAELNVNLLAYNYVSHHPGFCDYQADKVKKRAAFVLIDTPLIGNVTSFNKAQVEKAILDFEKKGTPIPLKIKELLMIRSMDFGDYGAPDEHYDTEVIETWKKRIFGCDFQYSEDFIERGLF